MTLYCNFPKRMTHTAKPPLHSELTQVMIDVFIHSFTPFVRSQFAKEYMRMVRAARRPANCESVYQLQEPLPFYAHISNIQNDKVLRSRAILIEWLLIRKAGLHQASQQSPDKHPRRSTIAHRELHSDGAVRQHLTGTHLAPQPFGLLPELCEPGLHLIHHGSIVESFHARKSTPDNPLFRNAISSSSWCCLRRNFAAKTMASREGGHRNC